MGAAADDKTIASAVKQMGEIITTLIRESFADINYDRAAENLRVLREELIDLEEPGQYNGFVRDLKKKIVGFELDGDRMDMWTGRIVAGRLGLITDQESEPSNVTEDEAKEVSVSIQVRSACTELTRGNSSKSR
jgi:ATP-dependent DNA helicase 2 subunit 2